MSLEIVKLDMNNVSSVNSSDVKKEFQDTYYLDNKIWFSETTINISNTQLNVDHIKTDFQSSEVNDTISNNVKVEDGICSADIQVEYCNGLPFCSFCHEVYQDYCTKCRVLIHILNNRLPHNTNDRIRELPKYMLETRELLGHLGIYSLKVIPENVRFGPFTGVNCTGLPLKIKGGRFVVSDAKSEYMNWMQYINLAKNIYEQNLFPFQYEDRLYYCSTRRIQEGEELLVYFGDEYIDNLIKNVEMDFFPITKEDVENVFACTFCCLGFSSKNYLTEHKAVCHNEMFSVEELVQCTFCKIYLDAKEYLKYHMDYCFETNSRHCLLPSAEIHKLQVEKRSSAKSNGKRRKCEMYRCTQCKFETLYNADFRHHINAHYGMKMYKCGMCDRRYKTKESLKMHVEEIHGDNEVRGVEIYSRCDCSKANIKGMNERSPHLHDGEKQCKCKSQTRDKYHLKSLIKIKHLNRGKYKCTECEFKANYKSVLERHIKTKHLKENDFKCAECEYQTNYKQNLKIHVKTKHLKQNDHKCPKCEYQTNKKSYLQVHVKTKHLKQNDYKCDECEFKTAWKSSLEIHVKTRHLKPSDYTCAECQYKTNNKPYLQAHIKTKHLKQNYYKCGECEFKTGWKSSLELHVKTKHLTPNDFKCVECEYKTNNKSCLQVHIKTKHLQQNAYKCEECQFETAWKLSLELHVNTKHLKQSNYKCAECEYKTNYKSNLRTHVKTKHLKPNNYKCGLCQFKTGWKSSLELHVKTKHLAPNDHKCTECEYKTNNKSHLQVHIKTKHLKQCDYKCGECEYQTHNKSYLQVHIQTKHLKQKNYKCTECEYKTNYKSNLQVHVRARHMTKNDF